MAHFYPQAHCRPDSRMGMHEHPNPMKETPVKPPTPSHSASAEPASAIAFTALGHICRGRGTAPHIEVRCH